MRQQSRQSLVGLFYWREEDDPSSTEGGGLVHLQCSYMAATQLLVGHSVTPWRPVQLLK